MNTINENGHAFNGNVTALWVAVIAVAIGVAVVISAVI